MVVAQLAVLSWGFPFRALPSLSVSQILRAMALRETAKAASVRIVSRIVASRILPKIFMPTRLQEDSGGRTIKCHHLEA